MIGDIHGCYEELEELLETAGVDTQNDCIISVGDVINKVKNNCIIIFAFIQCNKFSLRNSKVQELNSGTEASFSFFIRNIFSSVKRKNIAFRMFFVQFYDNSCKNFS